MAKRLAGRKILRLSSAPDADAAYPRGFWHALGAPGVAWFALWVLVPAYTIVAVSMGYVSDSMLPVPEWDPRYWNLETLSAVVREMAPGGIFAKVLMNTVTYVLGALVLCVLIGYPVAYYIAKQAGRWKVLLIVLLTIPFWTSYLMRMLAWIGLLSTDGYTNRLLMSIGILDEPYGWLEGHSFVVVISLAYGYLPYFILPLLASLDRIDDRLIDAGKDLGLSSVQTFIRVILPLSKAPLIAASTVAILPMCGDFYTTNLMSGSPATAMIGNQIQVLAQGGPQQNVGASLALLLQLALILLLSYYLYSSSKATKAVAA
ncbi:ABC transporter permease [Nocardioides glacieisoli]|uniref:ABC transporter permease n=1 Tax=Nocardioides glacieisoli TaxID=1168730 RepID=A0A4Q2RT70_9ACTN|nr:ABC transporter permease [Nocardioides glacieisoli]RYB92260.1 ABC transporter permease [Nocardioides glacieisoli]